MTENSKAPARADDTTPDVPPADDPTAPQPPQAVQPVKEIGGPKGPEPTRFGDWSVNGRCVDF